MRTRIVQWWLNFKNPRIERPSILKRHGWWVALDGYVIGWGDSIHSAYDSWLITKYKGKVVRDGRVSRWIV